MPEGGPPSELPRRIRGENGTIGTTGERRTAHTQRPAETHPGARHPALEGTPGRHHRMNSIHVGPSHATETDGAELAAARRMVREIGGPYPVRHAGKEKEVSTHPGAMHTEHVGRHRKLPTREPGTSGHRPNAQHIDTMVLHGPLTLGERENAKDNRQKYRSHEPLTVADEEKAAGRITHESLPDHLRPGAETIADLERSVASSSAPEPEQPTEEKFSVPGFARKIVNAAIRGIKRGTGPTQIK